MSRYRWLPPSKTLEIMDRLPSMEDKTFEEMQKLLFDAVCRGDVKVMLNDEVVPRAHVTTYLSLYSLANSDQEPNTLPPNLMVNYDDLCAVFDRPVVDGLKRGRPFREHAGWPVDRRLVQEMHVMLSGDPINRKAKSATEAARILIAAGKVPGAGTPESLAKRLVRAFRKYYTS